MILVKKITLYKFERKDKDKIRKQKEILKRLKTEKLVKGLKRKKVEIIEMFEGADTDQYQRIDFEKFLDSLKNIEIIPIKPIDKYC